MLVGWIVGKMHPLKEWAGTGTGCQQGGALSTPGDALHPLLDTENGWGSDTFLGSAVLWWALKCGEGWNNPCNPPAVRRCAHVHRAQLLLAHHPCSCGCCWGVLWFRWSNITLQDVIRTVSIRAFQAQEAFPKRAGSFSVHLRAQSLDVTNAKEKKPCLVSECILLKEAELLREVQQEAALLLGGSSSRLWSPPLFVCSVTFVFCINLELMVCPHAV